MKSYGQFCSLARSLDVVGDRWTLLIVRELLIGPSRYSGLLKSLPGIATNLFADRLRHLVEAGLVVDEEAPAPTSAKVYALTDRGRSLQPVLVELARWGVPYMASGVASDYTRGRWLGFAMMSLYPEGERFDDDVAPLRIRIDSEGEHILVEVTTSGMTAVPCAADVTADVTVAGQSPDVFRLLAGETAEGHSVSVVGDAQSRRRMRALTRHAPTYGTDLADI